MTITQALRQGVPAVRREPWNPYARMELPGGIWGELIDPCAHPEDPEKKLYFILVHVEAGIDPEMEGWEPWVKPDDYARVWPKRKRRKPADSGFRNCGA